jgi:hypothetical protein
MIFLVSDIAGDGYRMRAIINSVVTSYPFLNRRVEVQKETR